MKAKINNYLNYLLDLYFVGVYAAAGLIFYLLMQVPVMNITNESAFPMNIASVSVGQVVRSEKIELVEEFFGQEAAANATKSTIEQKVAFVASRKAFPASLAVIQKHEDTIKAKAAENGVPLDVAIGIGLLENGGSETAKSPAGALGVFQLMPGTARALGLTVDKKTDERKNPEKNIDAGMRYLKGNFERFGDWGLATWAYHAGEGNVAKAVKIYAQANDGVTLAGVKEPKPMKEYVEKHGITIHKLLSHPKVKEFTKKLNDDSSGYPYKVIATAKLFKEAK